jgi:nucleotide-binding universal stress UspA family protein
MKTATALRRITPKARKQANPAAPTERNNRIRTILAPVDFSAASTKGLRYAAALAKQFGAKIIPIFVVELPEVVGLFQLLLEDDEIKAACTAKLLKFARKAGVATTLIDHPLVRKGRAYREITEAARTLKVDLIVISTHGYSGLHLTLLGSVTERVVREAPCPVLVVRENERQFIAP